MKSIVTGLQTLALTLGFKVLAKQITSKSTPDELSGYLLIMANWMSAKIPDTDPRQADISRLVGLLLAKLNFILPAAKQIKLAA